MTSRAYRLLFGLALVGLLFSGAFHTARSSAAARAILSATPITAANAGQVGPILRLGRGQPEQAAWSPDGKTLAAASSVGVWLYRTDALDAEPRLLETDPTAWMGSLVFSPDSARLMTSTWDGALILWDTASGKLLKTPADVSVTPFVMSVAYSPDGMRFVTGSADGLVRIWETTSGKLLNTLSGHISRINAVAFSPDGARIVSASSDKILRLWDAASGKLLNTLSGHTGAVYDVAFSRDGTRIVSAGDDGTIRVWGIP